MLFEDLSLAELEEIIIPVEKFHPFPVAGKREAWNSIPERIRKKFIKEGEKYLNYIWPLLTATGYMDYYRTGNRSRFEALYFERRYALGSLVIAECLEGEDRFMDQIVNGLWLIMEETSWVIPAHNNGMADDYKGVLPPEVEDQGIDLFAAETAALLSWTYYLLKNKLDKISPGISQRIKCQIEKRIIDQYLKRDDLWWMGFVKYPDQPVNNWNPWCNSNCLAAFLLIEDDERRRLKGIKKVISSLDIFLDLYPEDGGCDEGPSYWSKNGGSLFDCLELLHMVSDGKINFYDKDLIQNIGRYIYRVHIDRDYFLNFADGNGCLRQQPEMLYRFGKRLKDRELMEFAAEFYRRSGEVINLETIYPFFRVLVAVYNGGELEKAPHKFPYLEDVWLPELEVMAVRRKEGTAAGLYLAAKGGHNADSHNHNDVGQFMIYVNGSPCLIDAGVETYTAKTFSEERYEIWTMRSGYHNLPTINGVEQAPGEKYRARDVKYTAEEDKVYFSMDIAGAYPEQAGLESWERAFIFDRSGREFIELQENISLKDGDENYISWNFLTVCRPEFDGNRIILKQNSGDNLSIDFKDLPVNYSAEEISLNDERLNSTWGECLYRITLDLNIDENHKNIKFTFCRI
ncbi:MAG: heparinase II/III domain-containing protein [Halanaerobiales bacterium]